MKLPRAMSLILAYLLILLAVFVLQRKLMYFPTHFSREELDHQLAALNLKAWPSAVDVRGFISKTNMERAKGTILVFHGNAGAAVHRRYYMDALQRLGYRVILAEYAGYGVRSGNPSEAELVKDAVATAKLAFNAFNAPLFLCGESLGSGVVSGVVASGEVPVQGLLLLTPFDAMAEVAQTHYWYFWARWLTLDKYDNIANLRQYQGAVAVILAEQDEVVPERRTMALFNALPEGKKRLWRFDNAGHNTLPMQPWQPWWQEAMGFLDTQG